MQTLLYRTKGDKTIWAIVILLALFSLLVVYSSTGSLAYKHSKSTESYLFKQIMFIAVGMMVVYFLHKVNYKMYSQVARLAFIISVPLLIYTLFFGVRLNEGSRWIKLPIIQMTIQTSDLAKLALFMYISRLLSKKQDVIKDFKKGFLPLIIPVGIVCLLIAPANLSTALLIGATSLLLMFIGRISVKHLALVIAVAAIPVVMLVMAAVIKHNDNGAETVAVKKEKGSSLFVRVDTWISRVDNFIYGGKDVDDEKTFHVNQMKIAISNGGWVGLGPGNSTQRNFMPHPYSDSVYATIIEEYGLLGGVSVLAIYLLFLFRCIRIFKKCPYAFGAFLALALSFTLVIQALANMAVNVNLMPVTGVTLPLVSMGGSSFIFTCIAIGIILSVARNVEQAEGVPQPVEANV
ncbi:MAG: cell division protein FtsW [Sphingobacteriales bacterium]|nr:MAG: cell division protein FtsW [Sphingobacteriales bacterium]